MVLKYIFKIKIIKYNNFFQKITKNCPAAGGFAPRPPSEIRLNYSTLLCSNTSFNVDIFILLQLLFEALSLNEFLVTCQHQATSSDLPLYDIFAPTKNSSFKVSDDVIAWRLWFGYPPIKNPGYAYVEEL